MKLLDLDLTKPSSEQDEAVRLAAKFEQLDIEHFSISSLNAYRENRMTWALRYLLKKYSPYPKPSMIRGQALESVLWNWISGGTDKPAEFLIRYFRTRLILQIIGEEGRRGLYPVTPKEWQGNQSRIAGQLSGFTEEKFWQSVLDIFENLHKIQGADLKEWMLPEKLEKLYKKCRKEDAFIQASLDGLMEFYQPMKEVFASEKKVSYQNKISSFLDQVKIPVIGFTDFEYPEYGIDLKTSMIKPKKPSETHICQAAFYSSVTGKPWRLQYVSPISSDDKKKMIFAHLLKSGLSAEETAKAYKIYSHDGKGTTKPTVEKFIEEMVNGWEEPKAVTEFELTPKQVKEGMIRNTLTARAIQHVIDSCRSGYMIEDMKIFCIDKPSGIMADPAEIETIREVWGLEVEEETD